MLDFELNCVPEVPGRESWLKVPLGKLDTERMVPPNEDSLELIDHVAGIRSPVRPLPHPRCSPGRVLHHPLVSLGVSLQPLMALLGTPH